MSDPTKIIPLVRAALPVAVDAVRRRLEGYPRLAAELARPTTLPLPVLGFGIPGGMRDERTRR